MTLTALEIKDKSFGTKFRGYDVEEVDEFLDIVVRKNSQSGRTSDIF